MFIAEAPGRLGAEVTGIPLFGDRTGDRFEELLAAMSWRRSSVFITNAVLCNPRDELGNNDSPLTSEIHNCSQLLRRTIEAVNPKLVIVLGRVALNATNKIVPHELELKDAVGSVNAWGPRNLGVLYHPGPRTQVHRSWSTQIADAKRVAEWAKHNLGIRQVMTTITQRQLFPKK
jgi:uracil-DNA glycosylase family 4